MALTADRIATEQLQIAREQLRASWAAAQAAELQAYLMPIGILLALLAAILTPFVSRAIEKARLKQIAADVGAMAAGAIGLPLAMAEEEQLWGRHDLPLSATIFDQAAAAISKFPAHELGDPIVHANLNLLALQIDSARTAFQAVATQLREGEPPEGLK